MVGILAICFAPRPTSDPGGGHPQSLAASVLAPTTMDHTGSTPAAPRETDAAVMVPLVVMLVALVLGALDRRFAPARVDGAPRAELAPRRRPPRRGPPLLAA